MFLTRNHVPYRWYDVERDDEGERLRGLAEAGPADLPLVLVPSGRTLRSPTLVDLADSLGLHTAASQPIYDVCIVGGGPAGLAAAVYAASEGLATVVVERRGAGRTGRAECGDRELPGLPPRAERCRSGPAGDRAGLAVRRGDGAGPLGDRAGGARSRPRGTARRGGEIEARSVIVASGVSYRRLDAPGTAELVGRGIFYGATAAEAVQTAGDEVYLVGAANSAGQAALNFAAARHQGRDAGARAVTGGDDVAVPDRPDRGRREHRGALPHGGRRRRRRRAPASR